MSEADGKNNERQDSRKWLSIITVCFPYVSSILIFLGVWRLMCFYSAFNIDILSYLELSEIITSFLDIVIVLIIQIAFFAIPGFLFESKKDAELSVTRRVLALNELVFINRLKFYFVLLLPVLLMIVVLPIVSYVMSLLTKATISGSFWQYVLYIAFFLVLLVIVLEIEAKHVRHNSSFYAKVYARTVFFVIFSVGWVWLHAGRQVSSIKESKSTYGTSIILDDEVVLLSDSTKYFIGKTHGYLFVHDEENETTDVIPMSKVKKMILKHNKAEKK